MGSCLLDLLLEDETIDSVISVVRYETERHHQKLNEFVIDYDHLVDYSGELRGHAAFCCLGTTIKKAGTKEKFKRVDYLYPFELAKIVRENKVPQFNIITAMGADKSSMIFYNKVKGEVEEALRYLNFESLNIFRPSLLMGERKETRVGEKAGIIFAKIVNPLMVGSLRKYKAIDASDVARAMQVIYQKNEKGFNIFQSDEIHDIAGEKEVYK